MRSSILSSASESNGANDHFDSETKNSNNQPNVAAPLTSGGLAERDREILTSSGRPAEEIEALHQRLLTGAKRAPNPKFNLAVLCERECDSVIADLGGRSVVRAKVFGTVLAKRGAYHVPKGWNAIGDHLGRRGHNLPMVRVGGVAHRDISFIGKTEEEKRERERQLRAMHPSALGLLIGEIKD